MGPPSSVWEKPLPNKYDSGNGFPGLKEDAKAPGAPGKAPPQASSPMKNLNYKEVQQDEVDALQAIYFEGFEEIDTRNAAWNVKEIITLFSCLGTDSLHRNPPIMLSNCSSVLNLTQKYPLP